MKTSGINTIADRVTKAALAELVKHFPCDAHAGTDCECESIGACRMEDVAANVAGTTLETLGKCIRENPGILSEDEL